MARMVYEVRYGLSMADVLMGRDEDVPQDDVKKIASRLKQQEPIQYVLGQADFCGRSFMVDRHVLIPRPETEELCRWVIETYRENVAECDATILDIGTGSGCIAVTLAAELPDARVTAWDVSPEALAMACGNARQNGVNVTFEQHDILNVSTLNVQSFDCIVSNPPYICYKERVRMEANVTDYEPHIALFVPDDDPLLFYRSIARYAYDALKPGGHLFFEINPCYAQDLLELLHTMSFHDIVLRNDTYGKPRMTDAQR